LYERSVPSLRELLYNFCITLILGEEIFSLFGI